MSEVCLCVVFNHPYPKNIPVLEAIYRARFPTMKYLIPFYRDASNPDVVPVYRGSYVHQGFATDAFGTLREINCSHLVFLQDDVLLNGSLNARNLLERLEVGSGDGFINQISSLNFDVGQWHWILGILWKFFYPRNQLSGTGVDSVETLLRYLPSVDVAREKLARYGVGNPVVTRTAASMGEGSVVRDIPYFGTHDQQMVRAMNELVSESLFSTASEKDRIEIPYPLALSAWGADFFIVPRYAFADYQHYAGILAAAGTFAEISVATALALACDSLVTAAGKPYTFDWIWTADREHLAEELASKLADEKLIAVHPVKIGLIGNDQALLDRIIHS